MKRVLPRSDVTPATLVPYQEVSLTTMPSDIISVLSKTMKPWDVLTCQSICKNWKQIFSYNDVWQHLLQKRFPHYRVPNEIKNFQEAFKERYQQMDWNFDHGVYALDKLNGKAPHPFDYDLLNNAVRVSGKQISCWDSESETWTTIYKLKDGELKAAALSDGKLFFATWGSKVIHVLDKAKKTHTQLDAHKEEVVDLAASNGKLVSVGSNEDGKIKVWDSNTLTCIAILTEYETPTTVLAVSNGKLIAGSETGFVRVWRLDNLSTDSAPLYHINENRGGIKYLTASCGSIRSEGSSDSAPFYVMDFNADHNEIFKQLADEMERLGTSGVDEIDEHKSSDQFGEVILRFERMPKAAKDKIFDEFAEILKEYNRDGLEGTPDELWEKADFFQNAQAIRNYLQKQTKTDPSKSE